MDDTVLYLFVCFLLSVRSQLVLLYLPVLMSLLLTEGEEEGMASSLARTQHELLLAKLTSLGAQFPAEFKVMC